MWQFQTEFLGEEGSETDGGDAGDGPDKITDRAKAAADLIKQQNELLVLKFLKYTMW